MKMFKTLSFAGAVALLVSTTACAATPAAVDWMEEAAAVACEREDAAKCESFISFAVKTAEDCYVPIVVPPGQNPPPPGWCPPDPRGSYVFRSSMESDPNPDPIPPFRLVYCFGHWIPDFMECVCREAWCL